MRTKKVFLYLGDANGIRGRLSKDLGDQLFLLRVCYFNPPFVES